MFVHRIKNILPSNFVFCTGEDLFCTLKVVSGEWYGERILEKMPSVPLNKTYRLSHLTINFVLPNRRFLKLKNVKITFFQQKTLFSTGKYE